MNQGNEMWINNPWSPKCGPNIKVFNKDSTKAYAAHLPSNILPIPTHLDASWGPVRALSRAQFGARTIQRIEKYCLFETSVICEYQRGPMWLLLLSAAKLAAAFPFNSTQLRLLSLL